MCRIKETISDKQQEAQKEIYSAVDYKLTTTSTEDNIKDIVNIKSMEMKSPLEVCKFVDQDDNTFNRFY